jgi:hypothetical protein
VKRAWPLIAGVVAYAVAVILWLSFDRHVPQKAFDAFSSENTSDKGLSLARRYLTARGGRVALLERPIDVRYLPANAVVFRAGEFMSFFDLVRQMDDEESRRENEKKEADARNGKAKKPGEKSDRDKKIKQDTGPKKDEKAKKDTASKKDNREKKRESPLHPKRALATPLLDADEEEWVRGGGRLILAPTESYGGLAVRGATAARATKVFPLWKGVDAIDEPEPRVLAGDAVLRATHALYTIGDAPAMSRLPLGNGDVILFPEPELLTNQHVAGNLPLLTAMAGDRRPVYFDEVAHGQRSDDGVLPLMKDWNLGPFLLLGLLGFAVALWRNSVPIGPREDDFRDTRSEAVDLVDSLGALYEQSMTNGDAIASYHHALTQAVAVQSGLRGEPLHKRVNDLTTFTRVPAKGERLDDETFRRSMTKINEAFARIER